MKSIPPKRPSREGANAGAVHPSRWPLTVMAGVLALTGLYFALLYAITR